MAIEVGIEVGDVVKSTKNDSSHGLEGTVAGFHSRAPHYAAVSFPAGSFDGQWNCGLLSQETGWFLHISYLMITRKHSELSDPLFSPEEITGGLEMAAGESSLA